MTFNTKDFPAEKLAEYDIEAQHPDDFVLGLIDLAPGRICNVVQKQADALKNPPATVEDVLERLTQSGLIQSVAEISSKGVDEGGFQA